MLSQTTPSHACCNSVVVNRAISTKGGRTPILQCISNSVDSDAVESDTGGESPMMLQCDRVTIVQDVHEKASTYRRVDLASCPLLVSVPAPDNGPLPTAAVSAASEPPPTHHLRLRRSAPSLPPPSALARRGWIPAWVYSGPTCDYGERGDQSKEGDSVLMLQSEKAKENNILLPSQPAYQRNQISYRNKLLEKEEEVFSQELEDQMKEWLCEENEISTPLTEEQKILLDSLPKLSMSDERLMSLCRPWKDALILTLLGKSANLEMMKDRIAWILRSKSFELIDLPNNYFLFKTGNRDLRLMLLFDGPWPSVTPGKESTLLSQKGRWGKCPRIISQMGRGRNAPGSRFYVLQDVEDRIHSKGVDRLRKTEVATTTWRRKEGEALSSIKEGVVESSEREKSGIGSLKLGKSLIESSESGTKEDVVGHKEKEKLNIDTDGKCSLVIGEPHLESSTVREKKEKVMKVKEKEGKVTNALVGQPVILSQSSDGYNLRPNGLSSVRNKKKASRAHNVIFGSTKTIEISKVSEAKEQAEGEKKDIVDIVPCNLDIVNSSTITIKNGKNDDVDRGAEDSEVVPPSLPLDELIEHIADDADFMEGQESLVGRNPV
ncbi:hypothetical protein K1719_033295 [Acacia pycnantha]|nr:hypothetical protein K1719_033295 [Acacia pycnantha]